MTHRVAIVGAGPSGFYAADGLLRDVQHPAAKMLVEVSKATDNEVGDEIVQCPEIGVDGVIGTRHVGE